MNSESMKKIREEKGKKTGIDREFERMKKETKKLREAPDWTIEVLTKPKGLKVSCKRYVHLLSEKELKDLMRGELEKEFTFKGKIDEEEIKLTPTVDLHRYDWLPKYMYRKFVRAVCDLLGIEYTPQMIVEMVFEPETPKATVEFREPTLIDKTEKRAEELKNTLASYRSEIDTLEQFFKGVKKK